MNSVYSGLFANLRLAIGQNACLFHDVPKRTIPLFLVSILTMKNEIPSQSTYVECHVMMLAIIKGMCRSNLHAELI